MEILENKFPHGNENTIHPEAVIDNDVQIAAGAIISAKVVIGNRVIIDPNSVINNCIICDDVIIGANSSGFTGFGYIKDNQGRNVRLPHFGKVIIESFIEIGCNACIDIGALGNTIIRKGTKIDNLVHIAHNVEAGSNAMLIANSLLVGSSIMDENVWVTPSASIMNQAEIGDNAIIGMDAMGLKSVEQDSVMVGNPARNIRKI